jgi:hypothetical protein
MGSGLGQLFHSNYVTSAVLITISLPFISVTVVSALLNRRLRHKLELIRQQVGRLAATVTVHQVVSKLQLDASCTASLEGGSDDSS